MGGDVIKRKDSKSPAGVMTSRTFLEVTIK